MHTRIRILVIVAAALGSHVSNASAATVFTNADVANNFVSTAGNWDNGLPTGGNAGTINIDAGYDSNVVLDGYEVTHTAGSIARSANFSGLQLGNGTTWVMNGATAAISSTRGISVLAGSQFTLEDGSANLTDNNRDTQVSGAGASLILNGGTMTIGRDFIVRDGGVFTVNGGTLSGIDQILTQNFATAAGGINFNGGSTTADNFQFDNAGGNTVTFGGSTVGSLSLLVGLGNGATLNWLPGSLMSLTIVGADQAFYEGLYTANTLRFDGSNADPFGDNFQVSGSTLSLVPVPEPASLTASGLVGLLVLGRICRRSCKPEPCAPRR